MNMIDYSPFNLNKSKVIKDSQLLKYSVKSPRRILRKSASHPNFSHFNTSAHKQIDDAPSPKNEKMGIETGRIEKDFLCLNKELEDDDDENDDSNFVKKISNKSSKRQLQKENLKLINEKTKKQNQEKEEEKENYGKINRIVDINKKIDKIKVNLGQFEDRIKKLRSLNAVSNPTSPRLFNNNS